MKDETNQIQALFVISVEDPQKVREHMQPYIMYTVQTRVRKPLFYAIHLTGLLSRQPHHFSRGLHFLSFDDIRIFFGCTRHFALTTLEL